jgi:TRAP-type mannitol/chloroaromatic compound transport system permease small subunit
MTTWRPLLWPFRAVIPVALVLLGAQALLGVVEAIQTIQKVDKT